MSNFTIEDYKTAIRANYKLAIEEDMSGVLSDPTPAQLRDFYLRLLEKGLSKIDEEIIKMFLRANENSSLKKAIENCNIEKLKPIISFLQGGNTENRQRIEMAAILINFQFRPFRKFQDRENILEEEKSIQDFNKSEMVVVENGYNKMGKVQDKDESVLKVRKPITLFISFKERFFKSLLIKSKWTITSVAMIFCLISAVIYLAYLKKDCMQWSEDHYERVDCDLKINGIMTLNSVEPFDESKFNLKKIKVCDTTTCFKNKEAIVWYAKTANGVDFFNTHGRHPESDKPLRPVTPYILNKYADK